MSGRDPAGSGGARQADWHLLLPQSGRPFKHLLLLGGSRELENTIITLGIARTVTREPSNDCPADAVVILAGARGNFEATINQLEDDGVLYWEVDRRTREHLATTPSRALGRIRALGLTVTGSYWVKPGFPYRNMYLPLGAAGAFRWYLDTLFRTPTLARRAVRALARATAFAFKGVSAIVPCYAITAVRGEARQPALIELARKGTASLHGDHLEVVLLASGEADWSRIVVLLFEPGADRPSVAVKLPRLAAFNQEIEREHHVLAELDAVVPRPSVPQSSLFRWNRLSLSAQTCVGGSSLNSRIGSSTQAALDDLRATAEWLSSFHDQTSVRTPAHTWLQTHLISGLCVRYEQTFGLSDSVSRLFDAMKRALPNVANDALPVVWQHTDFGPWNVYRNGDAIGVIDWEVGRRGPALVDLLYFVTHWSRAIAARTTSAERVHHFEEMFLSSVPTGRAAFAIHREVSEYMRRLAMPPSLYVFILVYMLIEQALERANRLTRLGRGNSLRKDNVYCDYIAAVAKRAERLFPSPTCTKPGVARADVTIAVATMERPAALSRCVDAILRGETLPNQLLIVDQSRDDRTEHLVAGAGWDRVVPVTYLRKSETGLARSRNAAVAHASQPIVVFTDDDCVADGRWLSSIVRRFDSAERPDAVTGRILPLGPDTPGFYGVSLRTSEIPAVYAGRSIPWRAGSGANTAVRREWFQRIGEFDTRLGGGSPGCAAEDVDILYRLLRAGAQLSYEPGAIIFHERQEADRRLRSRPSYGFGMGAFCAIWVRRYDSFALWMLAQWCIERGRALAASALRRRWPRVREELLMLRGLVSGIGYGLTCPQPSDDAEAA